MWAFLCLLYKCVQPQSWPGVCGWLGSHLASTVSAHSLSLEYGLPSCATLASGVTGPFRSLASGLSLPPLLSTGMSPHSTSGQPLTSLGGLPWLADLPCPPRRGWEPQGQGDSSRPTSECHGFPRFLRKVQQICKYKHFSDGCWPLVDFQNTYFWWVLSSFRIVLGGWG